MLVILCGCSNNRILEESNEIKEEYEKMLPANISIDLIEITNKLDIKCNSNGIPIELEQRDVSIENNNYVIYYNLVSDGEINENKNISFEYNKDGKIQSIQFIYKDCTDDIYQLLHMIEYMLQINELNIPVDEANEIYGIFNNTQAEDFWEKTINGRTYTWLDSRINGSDLQSFSITYNY